MEDDYLENHVIKSLMVDNKDQCELRCYAENFCSSFNLGISETRGKLKCELSDSDHFQHPEHLICHPTMVGILHIFHFVMNAAPCLKLCKKGILS